MLITIRDLNYDKELDKKAMTSISGGAPGDVVWSGQVVRTEGIGTFVTGNGEIVQRFKEVKLALVEGNTYDKSFIGPISTYPVP